MTETRPESGIDPRFDPRYQRGYVQDTAAAEAGDQPSAIVIAPADSMPPEPATPVGRPEQTSEPRPERGGPRVHAAAPERRPEAEDDDVLPAFDEVDDEPSPADPWFVAAWAVAVLAVVIGGAFWWAGMMAENPFSGVSQSDRWLQYVGWVVAPALVQGGLIGIVGMLVWTGIRRARRQGESS